ncbi:2557_t:CDS:2, partial [Gigaspora margarita]
MIRDLIEKFGKRNLSFKGKILVANTLILSRIWHIMNMSWVPRSCGPFRCKAGFGLETTYFKEVGMGVLTKRNDHRPITLKTKFKFILSLKRSSVKSEGM